jgi:hypothetical protein
MVRVAAVVDVVVVGVGWGRGLGDPLLEGVERRGVDGAGGLHAGVCSEGLQGGGELGVHCPSTGPVRWDRSRPLSSQVGEDGDEDGDDRGSVGDGFRR